MTPSMLEPPQCALHADGFDYPQMGALQGLGGGLFVIAQTSDDMAFVHSSWVDGIEPWRFQLPYESYSGPYIAHTIFDRTLLRAGETVHMKHIFRQHTMKGFSIPSRTHIPTSMVIEHYGSEDRYEFPIKWDPTGMAETTWKIPKEAKLGTYGVKFIGKDEKNRWEGEWHSGGFRVEEFRVPLLKGIIQPPTEPLINVKEVTLDLSVQYLAGGGAGLLPVRLRSEVRPKSIPPIEGFDHFVFSNGPVKEGLIRRGEPLEYELWIALDPPVQPFRLCQKLKFPRNY
jgi:hypothetical protein